MLITLPRARGISSGRPAINWGNPLSRGLVFLTYPGLTQQYDLVSGNVGTTFGTATWRGFLPSGHALNVVNAASDGAFWRGSDRLYRITTNMTFMVRCDISGFAASGGRLVTLPYTSSGAFNSVSFGRPGTGSNINITIADSAITTISSTTTAGNVVSTADPLTTYGVSRAGASVFFTRNQARFAAPNLSAAPVAWSGSREPLNLFNTAQNLANGTRGLIDFVAAWDRALTLQEMQVIQANPYILLAGTPVIFSADEAATPVLPSVVGTITTTLRPPVVASTGQAVARGFVSSSLPVPRMVALGQAIAVGVIAATITPPAMTATGTRVASGTIATTLPAPTATVRGVPVVSGAIASSLPTISCSALGSMVVSGTVATSLPAINCVASGSSVASGAVVSSLPMPTCLATGASIKQGLSTTTLPSIDCVAAGSSVASGGVNSTLPAPNCVVTATSAAQGTINASLPDVKCAATGSGVATGTAGSTILTPDCYASQTVGVIGTVATSLPAPDCEALGSAVVVGAIDTELPAINAITQCQSVATGMVDSTLPVPVCAVRGSSVSVGVISTTLLNPTCLALGLQPAPATPTAPIVGIISTTLSTPVCRAVGLGVAVGRISTTLLNIKGKTAPAIAPRSTPPERTLIIGLTARGLVVPQRDRTFRISRTMFSNRLLPLKQKTPAAKLDYRLDWSQYLARDGDMIVGSEWVLPAGLTEVTGKPSTFTDKTTTVWLAGGANNQTYSVINRITTALGRTDEYAFRLAITNYLT